MKILLLIHGFIALAASLVLIFSPATIPSIINIKMQPDQYLIAYLLGGAELGIAFLSFRTTKDKRCRGVKSDNANHNFFP